MRYFFDVHDGTQAEDEEGMECPSVDAAIAEAANAAAGMSADIIKGGSLTIEVRSGDAAVAAVTVSISIDRKQTES
jgi:hypothetical protein